MNSNRPVGAATSADKCRTCGARLVQRVAGRWCPRCRRWLPAELGARVASDAAQGLVTVSEEDGSPKSVDRDAQFDGALLRGSKRAKGAKARFARRVELAVDRAEPLPESLPVALERDEPILEPVDAIVGTGRDDEDAGRDERGEGDGSQGGEGKAHSSIISRHGNVDKHGQVIDFAGLPTAAAIGEPDDFMEAELVRLARERISEAAGPYVGAGVNRSEYLDGILLVVAAAKGWRVPPEVLGLEVRP